MRRDETRKISALKQHKTYLHSISGKPQFVELSLARCYIQCRRTFILIFNHLIKKLQASSWQFASAKSHSQHICLESCVQSHR